MTRLDKVLALVQAGGKGSRMDVLTRERAKPALAFAGSYQLIDFALSSVAHSYLPDVWISVQYQAGSLDDHLAGGRPWDLDRTGGGYRRLVPQEGGAPTEAGFSTGNADNLWRYSRQIRDYRPDLLVVMSADHVFSLDLRDVIDEHRRRQAECTLVTSEVTKLEARNKAVVEADEDGLVHTIENKPTKPSTGVVATEIIIYNPAVLQESLQALQRERVEQAEDDEDSGLGDFGELLLPRLVERGRVYAYPMPGYWRDLGRPEAYLAAHYDLIAGKVDVFDHPGRPVMTRWPHLKPATIRDGAVLADSIISTGCEIAGEVRGSVLGPGVVIAKGASVVGSVLGAGVRVEAGARVATAVVDERSVIEARAEVGAESSGRRPRDEDIVLVGVDSRIAAGAAVPAGGRLEPGTIAD